MARTSPTADCGASWKLDIVFSSQHCRCRKLPQIQLIGKVVDVSVTMQRQVLQIVDQLADVSVEMQRKRQRSSRCRHRLRHHRQYMFPQTQSRERVRWWSIWPSIRSACAAMVVRRHQTCPPPMCGSGQRCPQSQLRQLLQLCSCWQQLTSFWLSQLPLGDGKISRVGSAPSKVPCEH